MNLKTEQGRKSAIEEIETSFIKSLREIGVELSDEAYCDLTELSLSVHQSKQSTDAIYIRSIHTLRQKNQINFGTSGAFTPENKEAYWRTIHAASILKNWDKVCEAVNEHCKRYSDLVEEIKKQNP